MDREDLEKLAELARIELGPDEVERLARDCRAILEHFDAVRGVQLPDVSDGESLEAPVAESRVVCDPLLYDPEEMAPAWKAGFFTTPRPSAIDSVIADDVNDI